MQIALIVLVQFASTYNSFITQSYKDSNMLSQSSRMSKLLEKQLLKCILPCIVSNSQWIKWVSQLAKTTTIIFDKKNSKQKKAKCIVCNKMYDNYLLFVFHLELIHQDQVKITKYEFYQQTLTIFFKPHPEKNTRSLYDRDQSHQFQLLFSLRERSNRIFESIWAKFCKKQSEHRKKYFHPVNIFKYMDESDEESEDPYGNIEQQLQRIKISEFTDINQNDKLFFIKWNEAVHQAKKLHVYLSDDVMRQLLQSFAKQAKVCGLKRANLLMHGFTLWSSGKITSDQVTVFLTAYDNHKIA